MKDLIYDYSNDWMRHLAGGEHTTHARAYACAHALTTAVLVRVFVYTGQVECRLDGARFTSKAAFYLHLRGAHPDRFEDLERLLRSLTEGSTSPSRAAVHCACPM
jgi:hypothetical protein